MTSRAAAQQRLLDFQERVASYPDQRNFDRPGHEEVSRLSQWIRYRVVTEEECVATTLQYHPFEVAEKFVQEVVWRTYWKGWLELRPQVWRSYRESLADLREQHAAHKNYSQAIEGRTGLPFFDDWVRELRSSGYLHNHTRMWFASVWIFTLQLPWQLGADFMHHHLLDGDPASNTLSWRWVGGLHTPGKIYVARPDNIARYSDGRWCPTASDLNLNPRPLVMDDIGATVPLELLSKERPRSGDCVLLHDDDMSADLSEELAGKGAWFLQWVTEGSDRSEMVREHTIRIRQDVRDRTTALAVKNVGELLQEMRLRSTNTLHMIQPLCGEVRDEVMGLKDTLAKEGVRVLFHRRAWDELYFPFAKTGFFPFWTSVKRRLHREG